MLKAGPAAGATATFRMQGNGEAKSASYHITDLDWKLRVFYSRTAVRQRLFRWKSKATSKGRFKSTPQQNPVFLSHLHISLMFRVGLTRLLRPLYSNSLRRLCSGCVSPVPLLSAAASLPKSIARMADPLEICIPNVGVYVKEAALKSALEAAGVKGMVCVHKLTMRSDAYIVFTDDASRDTSLPLIRTVVIRGSKLSPKPSTGANSIPAYKRLGDAAPPPPKRPRGDGAAPAPTGAPPRSLADAVTPWHTVPYEEQLARKEAAMRAVLQAVSARLASHAIRNVKTVPNFVSRKLKKFADAAVAKARDEEAHPAAKAPARAATAEAGAGSSASAAEGGAGSAAGAGAGAGDATGVLPAVGQKRKIAAVDADAGGDAEPPAADASVAPAEAAADATEGQAVRSDAAADAAMKAYADDAAAAADAGAATGANGPDAAASAATGGAAADGAGGSGAGAAAAAAAAKPKFGNTHPHPLSNLRADLAALLPPWLLPLLPTESEACPVRAITPSPLQSAYRNKAGLTVARDAAGRTCAGHRTGAYSEGTAVTAPGPDCMLYSPGMSALAHHVNSAFFATTPLAPVDLHFQGDRSVLASGAAGVWHTLTLREAWGTGEMMVVLLTRPIRAVAKAPAAASVSGASAGAGAAAADAAGAGADAVAAPEEAADAEAAVDGAPAAGAGAGASSSAASASPSAPAAGPTDAELAERVAAYEAELARFASLVHGWRPAGVAADAPVSPSAPKVVSVMLQEWDGAASAPPQNHPHRVLAGQAHIVETMCGGLRFCISPGAFFQVNTPGADVLYGMVRNLAVHGAAGAEMPPVFTPVAGADASAAGGSNASSSSGAGAAGSPTAVAAATTALADVCCGTGTIGLACARDFARIVGVELSSEAIDDAKRNAALNGIPNAVFLCERAENVMKDVLDRASAPLPSAATPAGAAAAAGAGAAAEGSSSSATAASAAAEGGAGGADAAAAAAAAAAALAVQRVVAIVDPPRAGLHATVIKALRTSRHVKRLVYVSCNPSGTFIDDAVKLCTPQEANSAFARGPAFRPVLAAPMDMFPQTAHTELVCLFERD